MPLSSPKWLPMPKGPSLSFEQSVRFKCYECCLPSLPTQSSGPRQAKAGSFGGLHQRDAAVQTTPLFPSGTWMPSSSARQGTGPRCSPWRKWTAFLRRWWPRAKSSPLMPLLQVTLSLSCLAHAQNLRRRAPAWLGAWHQSCTLHGHVC